MSQDMASLFTRTGSETRYEQKQSSSTTDPMLDPLGFP